MLLLAILAAAPSVAKTTAMDDWQTLTITNVAGEANGPLYLQVHAGDLDRDGTPDDAVVKLACVAGKLTGASYQLVPRDSASGMATGRRQHAPITIVKEWGAASPALQKIRPQYDVKTLKGNERAADGWTQIALSSADGLCPTAKAAAAVVKSKSNITNN